MSTVNQPTAAPENKVTSSTLGAVAATMLYTLAEARWPLLADPAIKIGAAAQFAGLVTLAFGYAKSAADRAAAMRAGGRNWWIVGAALVVLPIAGYAAAKLL